jgi:2-polyprenyl-3-methyl-5-hydroxy-6-metoxy-1,4-benzoquinol methylase
VPATQADSYAPCDLCGSLAPTPLLESSRLDGPLVRCRQCGLVYVGRRARDFTFAGADRDTSDDLARRVDSLALVDRDVEDAEEPWRRRTAELRVARLRRHITAGELLDVGCAGGDFLQAAADAGFDVEGVEPEPTSSERARNRGLRVTTATLPEAGFPPARFDAVTMLHVLEHVDSPRATLGEVHRILRPGGVLAVETPTIDTLWFRLLRRRWRQLIPDHYYFFTAATLSRALEEAGFRTLEIARVGKPVSVRLLTDRVRRASPLAGRGLRALTRAAGVDDRTLNVNPGDVMLALARRERPTPSQ